MRQLLGAIGLHRGKGQPLRLFDDPASVWRLSVVSVVSDLQSELRLRREGPSARAAPRFNIRTDMPLPAFQPAVERV